MAIAPRGRARPRRTTWCCSPARATRTTRRSRGVKHAVLRCRRTPRGAGAARAGAAHERDDDAWRRRTRWLPGAHAGRRRRAPFARVHSDTRTLRRATCSSRCKGERFDAHDFLAAGARRSGAVAALAERGLAEAGLPGLAGRRHAARRCGSSPPPGARRFDLPLIAVTGSNGKTTVTQMIAAILRAWLRRRGVRHRRATSTTTSACR